jgi:hypothetical protein
VSSVPSSVMMVLKDLLLLAVTVLMDLFLSEEGLAWSTVAYVQH